MIRQSFSKGINAQVTLKSEIATKQNGERFDLPEGIYTIRKKAGVDGTLIDSFAPSTRYNDYKQKLVDAKADWEDTVGLDRVAKHYNLSASATVDMLIAKETRLIDKQRKEDEGK